jgi:DNA-binding NtrC family response regulator
MIAPIVSMLTLIADRFLWRRDAPHPDRVGFLAALDLATGEPVRVRIREAGTHVDQEAWVASCTRAYDHGTLVDFGFIGADRRFEATSAKGRRCRRVSASPASVIDWLEHPRPSSGRHLKLPRLPDPRDLRASGFVPIDISVVTGSMSADVLPLIEGRSVVLFDPSGNSCQLALVFLKAGRANVREVSALQPIESKPAAIEHAAEGRLAYGPPSIPGGRPGAMFAEADRLLASGRHAAAERALRAGAAAFDRRGDTFHTGEAHMSLGRLLLTRGRAADARAAFDHAHERFQCARAPVQALSAMRHLGMAQTDLGLFADAERSCRAAHSAASVLQDADALSLCGVGLARALVWQQRFADAQAVLDSCAPPAGPEAIARYWCLAARLRLAADDCAGAWRSIERARPHGRASEPVIESLVRRWEAAVQSRVGDLEAVEVHVRAGLAAARAAHLPLRALKLRLTVIEGLLAGGKLDRARSAARQLRTVSRASLPPLLRRRIDRAQAQVEAEKGIREPRLRSPAMAHEAVTGFQPAMVGDLDGLKNLLSLAHQVDDEREALVRAAACIRKHTHAIGVGIFGFPNGTRQSGTEKLLACAGAASAGIAARAFDAGLSIGPEAAAGGVEAAVPLRYLNRVIGSIAIRWSVEGPEHGARAMSFVSAAAEACAPPAYVLQERQVPVAQAAGGCDLIGVSAAMEDVRRQVARAASAPFTVLIEGESGSGKELVARAIHTAGCRRERRFCALNCAAMPEELVDAELFGHAKGAFTGAGHERVGLFESADGGTVFLDEVGELSARAQAKVLRVLQEGEVRRIGENFTRSFDTRLVAATNRPLRTEVEAGRFRQDLLYRLDVIRIAVPPLRDRVEDIPLLASLFWRQSAERIGSKAVLGQAALSMLARYDWPGNVRELQNVLAALVVAVPSRGVVPASALPAAVAGAARFVAHESLESARVKFEQRFVRAALARTAGHRGRAAAALGLSRQGFAKLMQRLHVDA